MIVFSIHQQKRVKKELLWFYILYYSVGQTFYKQNLFFFEKYIVLILSTSRRNTALSELKYQLQLIGSKEYWFKT